jgi:DNA-directed RNA polymerase subunit RPC12/RpoP
MIQFRVEENGILVDIKIDGLKMKNSNKILDTIREIAANEIDDSEENSEEQLKEGYQALATDKVGLHHPKSEYETKADQEIKDYGIKEFDGEKKYQLFYVCDKCSNKRKRYIPKGSIYTNCHDCGHRMNVRPATSKGVGHKDEYSNYYIAGLFQQQEQKYRQIAVN